MIFIYLLLISGLFADNTLEQLEKELNTNFQELKKKDNPPYFMSYSLTETKVVKIYSSFGTIISDDIDHTNTLDVSLRVGDYKLDNTHIIRGNAFEFGGGSFSPQVPLKFNTNSLKQAAWLATDKSYKAATERYEKVQTNKAVKIEEEDKSNDFSKEDPVVDIRELQAFPKFDKEQLISRLNQISSEFINYDWIYSAMSFITIELKHKYFVSTEGTKLRWSEPYIRIMINIQTKSEDGMSLPVYKDYFVYDINKLPSNEVIKEDVKQMISILDQLRKAPLMSTYSGPAILSGEASGVFFHEIFGHRVEGHREKDPNSSQTFKQSIGKEILPTFINVVFDPTRKERDGRDLSGNYPYDDEGVKSQKVVAVEKGIFKGFLMSRIPIDDFPKSNGHGRRQEGYSPVSRQSNLIVESDKSVSEKELRKQLIKLAKEQDREFGLFFKTVQGGFTFTSRTIPNAFNVLPLVVYKIFVDGRPDELVRGVDLIGTPLTTFENIVATSDQIGIFNGVCGAESGGVPVSASSPSLLVRKIEVQKKQKSQSKLPILNAPKIKSVD